MSAPLPRHEAIDDGSGNMGAEYSEECEDPIDEG